MVEWTQLALWALVTAAPPVLMALVPLSKAQIADRSMHLMLGFSAGVLGGVAILDILPEAFRTAEAIPDPGLPPYAVPLALGAGFLALLLVERHLLGRIGRGHVHGHIHTEDGRTIQPFGTLAVSALTIHGAMDGFVIPLGFQLAPAIGTVILLVVAIHQIPDSFAALAVGVAAGHDRRTVATYVIVTALDTPIGIALGVLFLGAGVAWLPLGLAFSAGTFLFVSAADLVPELQHRSRSLLVTLTIVFGFLFVFSLSFLPGA
ncbi:MAG TPA: ZIP family metal transporter [Thermoplasmata archaeon]